jgi:hypothetical protein
VTGAPAMMGGNRDHGRALVYDEPDRADNDPRDTHETRTCAPEL